MPGSLAPEPLELDLGPFIKSAGFRLGDYDAVVAELSREPGLTVAGAPERAVAKRRAEFLAGRWAARRALAELGVDATPTRSEDGSPRWPDAIVGSITHGAGRALCAVARASEVRSLGIDAERLLDERAKDELLARICGEGELELLGEGLKAPLRHLVSFAFSAKESLYKCLYPLVGKFMDFSAARVVEVRGELTHVGGRGMLTLELSADWSAEFARGRRFEAPFFASASHVESAIVLLA